MAYKDKETARIKNKEWWDKNQDKIRAYRETHREEHNEYSKAYHKNHKDVRNEWSREYRKKNKLIVVSHYGKGTCECVHCGYSDIRALQIDHIHGGGEAHRRGIKQDFYVWLIKNDFPNGFQVLCANCQQIKMCENKERANRWLKEVKK